MTVHELRLALTVDNFDEALAFYRDTLGLEQLEIWTAPGTRAVLLDAGRATLELFDEGQAEMVDELENAGATRLGGPVDTPWRDRNVRLEAPDGMQLTLFTPLDT